jgi:hypothetical protein
MNCGGLFLAADFLYWRAENHGFSYAYQFTSANPNVGTVTRINPQWDPAFRVGLGWNTPYDFWDIFLNYTWVRNRIHQSKSNALGFVSLWPVSTESTGTFSAVSAKSRFMLNIGDLEIGRLVYLTKSLAIRPHLGARGGTIHQKFNSDFTVPLTGSIQEQTFSGKQNYWGVGPRVGANGEWHLSQGFSLLARAAGALLYGKNDVMALTQTRTSEDFNTERQYGDDFYQLVPNMQLLFGFQWQTCFWCEKMFFKMSASWETNYWWDQFNLPVGLAGFSAPQPTVGQQALTMEGLTVNFEWDF